MLSLRAGPKTGVAIPKGIATALRYRVTPNGLNTTTHVRNELSAGTVRFSTAPVECGEINCGKLGAEISFTVPVEKYPLFHTLVVDKKSLQL